MDLRIDASADEVWLGNREIRLSDVKRVERLHRGRDRRCFGVRVTYAGDGAIATCEHECATLEVEKRMIHLIEKAMVDLRLLRLQALLP